MSWLFILIFAYLLNATATTIDKFLLTKKIPNAAVYTFFIGFLGLAVFVLAPFNFYILQGWSLVVALLSGVFFTIAMLYMFKALNRNEISRIGPFIGGLQPIIILILAWFFLKETLDLKSLVAFFIILGGTFLISRQDSSLEQNKLRHHNKSAYLLATVSAFAFSISYILSKYVFNYEEFITGLIWTRIGAFIAVLFLLLKPKNLKDIWQQIKPAHQESKNKRRTNALFITGQIFGALSAILVYYAISISDSVAIINATRGMEYVFLLIIIIVLSRKYPKLLEERLTPKILIQKIIAITLIIIGLFILFI